MIQDIINDINVAREHEAYISALALTLTIPDLCGKIEFGHQRCGGHYKEWFDKWVHNRFCQYPKSECDLLREAEEAGAFDGEKCYALRCALLHSGNTELTVNQKPIVDVFELCVYKESICMGTSTIVDISSNKVGSIKISFNVSMLIDLILLGLDDFIKDWKSRDKENKDIEKLFQNFAKIKIVNEKDTKTVF